MAEALVFELSREQIVGCAREAIARTRRDGMVVGTSLVRRLMRVARTAPEFALGTWFIKDRCGCLVGNLHFNEASMGPYSPACFSKAEFRVGLEFDGLMREALSARDKRRLARYEDNVAEWRDRVVRVVG